MSISKIHAKFKSMPFVAAFLKVTRHNAFKAQPSYITQTPRMILKFLI